MCYIRRELCSCCQMMYVVSVANPQLCGGGLQGLYAFNCWDVGCTIKLSYGSWCRYCLAMCKDRNRHHTVPSRQRSIHLCDHSQWVVKFRSEETEPFQPYGPREIFRLDYSTPQERREAMQFHKHVMKHLLKQVLKE